MKLNIASKINIYTIVISVLVSTFFIFAFMRYQINQKKYELNKHISFVIKNLAYNSEFSVLINDRDELMRLAAGIIDEEEITYLSIETMSGISLLSLGQKQSTKNIEYVEIIKTKKMSGSKADLMELNEEGEYENIAKIKMQVSLEPAYQKIAKALIYILLLAIVINLLAALISNMYIKKIVVKPLNPIMLAIEKISQGVLGYRIAIVSSDELGEVATAINKMSVDLSTTLVSKKELQDSFDFTNNLIEDLPVGIIVVDQNKKISTINSTAKSLLCLKDEIIGQECDSKICRSCNGNCPILDEELESVQKELNINLPNGEVMTLYKQVRKVKILGKDMLLEIFVDVSEQKRAEAENLKLQQTLMQQTKLASIGQLGAGVAHELNNPLTSIVGSIDILLEELEGVLNSEQQEDFKTMKASSMRMKKIISDLLLFSRRGKWQPGSKVKINEVINSVLDLMAADLRHDSIHIIKDFGEEVEIMGEKDRLMQVFINLISNSRDALSIRDERNLNISTEYLPEEKIIKIRIRDNGEGISGENLEKIFDPFFTTKAVDKGTGLGLSIIYGIIENMKGSIVADSVQGEFTEFTITFPGMKIY